MSQCIETAIAIALRLATGTHGWTLPEFLGRGHPGLDLLRLAAGLAIGMGIAVAIAVARETAGRNQ